MRNALKLRRPPGMAEHSKAKYFQHYTWNNNPISPGFSRAGPISAKVACGRGGDDPDRCGNNDRAECDAANDRAASPREAAPRWCGLSGHGHGFADLIAPHGGPGQPYYREYPYADSCQPYYHPYWE